MRAVRGGWWGMRAHRSSVASTAASLVNRRSEISNECACNRLRPEEKGLTLALRGDRLRQDHHLYHRPALPRAGVPGGRQMAQGGPDLHRPGDLGAWPAAMADGDRCDCADPRQLAGAPGLGLIRRPGRESYAAA